MKNVKISAEAFDEITEALRKAGARLVIDAGSVMLWNGMLLERGPKLSRNATTAEIFPGTHGPVQRGADPIMQSMLRALKAAYGDRYGFTVFVSEWSGGRFNYGSTCSRADMIAVLRGFIEKQEQEGRKLDVIEHEPPTGARQ